MTDTNDAENLLVFFRKFDTDYVFARQTRATTTPHFDMLRVFGLHFGELRHSLALRWFLHQDSEHEQGPLFTETLLKFFKYPLEAEMNYDVEREKHGRIDVSVYAPGRFAVFIENKVRHFESPEQVENMTKSMARFCAGLQIPREHRFAMFLTDTGFPPVTGPKEDTPGFLLANLQSISRVELFEAFRNDLSQKKNHSAILMSFLDSYLYSIRLIRHQLS